jgi:hypothetical protein
MSSRIDQDRADALHRAELRVLMSSQGLTRAYLGDLWDVAPRTVQNWRNGGPIGGAYGRLIWLELRWRMLREAEREDAEWLADRLVSNAAES